MQAASQTGPASYSPRTPSRVYDTKEALRFPLFSFCHCFDGPASQWRPEDQDADRAIKAIRGEYFSGTFLLPMASGQVRISPENQSKVFDWFGETVSHRLGFRSEATYYITAMPDSTCTVAAKRPSKVQKLVDALVAKVPTMRQWDGLRFSEEVPKSVITHRRCPEDIYDALVYLSPPPKDGVLLIIDDVCHTGAHFAAVAASLRLRDCKEIRAISAGRRANTRIDSDRTFDRRREMLDIFEPEN